MGDRKGAYRVLVRKSERQRQISEDLCVDWSIILKWFIRKYDGGLDFIYLAPDIYMFQSLVKEVMNIGVQ
jgi:hypothetical protein